MNPTDTQASQPPFGGLSAVWSRVDKTDATFTKAMPGSFAGTSINPTYQIKRATEIFGPIGLGWGYEIIEDGFHEGAHLGYSAEGESWGNAKVHILRLRFWYRLGSDRAEFEHFGQTPFVGRSSAGLIVTDGDVKKKSLTDALTKCLSMLGFSADIYSGRWDDDPHQAGVIAGEGSAPSLSSPPAPTPATSAPPTRSGLRRSRAPSSHAQPAAQPAPADPAPQPPGQASTPPDPMTSEPASPSVANGNLSDDSGTGTPSAVTASQPAPSPPPKQPAASVADWLRRANVISLDALPLARQSAEDLFSGDDLVQVLGALDNRHAHLSSRLVN